MDFHAWSLALLRDPADTTLWFAWADWLEERSDPRAELVRLHVALRTDPPGPTRLLRESRLRQLLASGVQPCLPSLVNFIGMELILIPPGRFLMGSPFSEPYHSPDEGPVHEVEITRPFYLGRFPVTQEEFEFVMGRNPSHFASLGLLADYRLAEDTRRFPVDTVDYQDAERFCQRLSALHPELHARRRYRLPTEAEWEYACRGGTSSAFYVGEQLSSHHANFDGNYPYGQAPRHLYLKRTCAVGRYPPNPFGLYDLYGNVWEWCSDWYDEHYYARSPRADPQGPLDGDTHVLRGGSWIDPGWHCRSADRSHLEALHFVGFRVAMDILPD